MTFTCYTPKGSKCPSRTQCHSKSRTLPFVPSPGPVMTKTGIVGEGLDPLRPSGESGHSPIAPYLRYDFCVSKYYRFSSTVSGP